MMFCTFVKSASEEAIRAFCAGPVRMYGLRKGVAATTARGEDGDVYDVPAKGNPDYWYAAVSMDNVPELAAGVEFATWEEILAVPGMLM